MFKINDEKRLQVTGCRFLACNLELATCNPQLGDVACIDVDVFVAKIAGPDSG
jgi:hypothetical protein